MGNLVNMVIPGIHGNAKEKDAKCPAHLNTIMECKRGAEGGANFMEDATFFFLIAGCNGSLGYWQSLATRETNKQHQWYCVPEFYGGRDVRKGYGGNTTRPKRGPLEQKGRA